MKNKKILTLVAIIVPILLIVLVITSATQAYFNRNSYAKNPTEYQTGLLSIEAVSKSNNISLSNTLPMSDTEGEQSDPYVFTIKNNGNVDYKFNVKLLSTNDNTFSPEYIKIKIDDEGVKTLSSLTDSIIKKDIILPAGETIDITLRVWLSSDTKNTEIGKTFNSKIVIDGQSIYTSTNTDIESPLKDFTYYLGDEYSEVDNIHYYNEDDGNYYDISITPIPLESNEILLTKYNGINKNVTIPDTYTIGDTIYNVVILSDAYVSYYDESTGIDIDTDDGIFQYNSNIESVYLGQNIKIVSSYNSQYYENDAWSLFNNCTSLVNVPEIPSGITTMSYAFFNCTSLIIAPEIPNSVTTMEGTFRNCTSLVTAPEIPSGVANMSYTFYDCASLVNVPTIPSSVTNMSYTFYDCTSLINAPEISSSVTSMSYTFSGCTSLVNAPEIPSSVTSMSGTFSNCTSLVNAPEIPSGVTSMSSTFQSCTSLVNAPEIPSSVTDMSSTFRGCTSLVTSPTIPSAVTVMTYTFQGCTSLVTAPEIPSSVTNMRYTFNGCTSLVTAPVIPDSVTNMYSTFQNCTNLTGIVKINSSKVSSVSYIFAGTSKSITVQVPSGSTTYTKINALTTTTGKPSNVTLTTY